MKVIHICGESAVGKNFLRRKIEAKDSSVLERFEIDSEFEIHGPVSKNTGVEYPEVRQGVLQTNTPTVIHHWQWKSDELFADLHNAFPKVQQRIVLVWREPAEHFAAIRRRQEAARRAGRKPGYLKWDEQELVKRWIRKIVPNFVEKYIQFGIPIEVVDGGSIDYDARDDSTLSELIQRTGQHG